MKILLNRKDVLLKPLYFSNELMETQFYDKIEEYKTLEYMDNNIKYQIYEQKHKKNIKFILILKQVQAAKRTNHIYCDMKQKMETEKNLLVKMVL